MCCDDSITMTPTPVKEEIDEYSTLVKEEITIDEHSPVKEEIIDENIDFVNDEASACTNEPIVKSEYTPECLMLAITRPTFVYTTKLDDMEILKQDLSEYDFKEIIQKLLAESKPIYSPDNIPSQDSETNLLSYAKIHTFVQEINCMSKLEAEHVNQRNQKLIKQCKPCSVVLQDIKTQSPNRLDQNRDNVHSRRDSSPDDDDVIENDSTLKIFLNKTVLLALVHNNNVAYVYRFNLRFKAVTHYFVITDYNYNMFRDMYPHEPRNILHYCCWFKREAVIEKLSLRSDCIYSKNSLLLTMKLFLKQPHACRPGDCSCCCYVGNTNTTKSKIPQETEYTPPIIPVPNLITLTEESDSLQTQSSKSNNGDLIRKAMHYNPEKRFENVTPVEKENKRKKSGNILLRLEHKDKKLKDNQSVHEIKDKDLKFDIPVEFYVLGEGDIINSFTVNDKKEADKIESTYISMRLPVVKKLYCCWYSRENLITCLRILKFSANVIKYLRTSHICKINKCKCCCQPKIANELKTRIKAREKTYTHWPAVLNHTTAYNKTPISVTIPSADIPATKENKRTVSCNEMARTKPIIYSIREEDKHVINKIKNLKISVNREHELEVVLNSPAKNLSVLELKVMHHILCLSSKQIAQMQITPEEFCRRINASVFHSTQTSDLNSIQSVPHPKQTSNVTSNQSLIHSKQTSIVNSTQSVPHTKQTSGVNSIRSMAHTKQKSDGSNVLSVVSHKESFPNKINRLPETRGHQENNHSKTRVTREPDMYEELTHLMSVKSSHLGNSFKINYKSSNFCQTLPVFRVFPGISKTLTVDYVSPTHDSPNLDNQIPKITNLPPTSMKISIQKACSENVEDLLRKVKAVNCQRLTVEKKNRSDQNKKKEDNCLKENKRKRGSSPDHVTEEKRIRVKPPSELIDLDSKQTFRDTSTNIINPFSSMSDSQTYILGNKVIHSQNLASVVKSTTNTATINNVPAGAAQRIIVATRLSQPAVPASHKIQIESRVQTTNQGTKWMTLGPMPSTTNTDYGPILAKMLKSPHVQPASPSYYVVMPPLVKIGSPSVAFPNVSLKPDQIQSPADKIKLKSEENTIIVDNSANMNLIQTGAPKIILEHREEKLVTDRLSISNKRKIPGNIADVIILDDDSMSNPLSSNDIEEGESKVETKSNEAST